MCPENYVQLQEGTPRRRRPEGDLGGLAHVPAGVDSRKGTTLKKVIAVTVGLLGMLGGAVGVAVADPGPNGKNNHGLCTALFNGSDTGRANKAKAGPFATLIANSPDGPSDDDDAGGSLSDAWDWCSDPANNPKGIGGNPENPTTPETEGNGKNGRGKG